MMRQILLKISAFLLLIVSSYSPQSFAIVSQLPLFLTEGVPPIVMITMGRDHKLYYEAYNDAGDLNSDGVFDIRYKPTEIDYYGYFDSYKCYNYTSGKFAPSAVTADKKCSGNWSGDFLNYLTTSRMDALRKVLYGGSRSTDTTSETILKRTFIPQDAHSWGKEYTSIAVDGYDISHYSPLSTPITLTATVKYPTPVSRHLFANTTLSDNGAPLLRVLESKPYRIWQWVSKERPVADNSIMDHGSYPSAANEGSPDGITDYHVYVEVCKSGLEEANCKVYSDGNTTVNKPIGLLQRYGDDELMAFGLLTGSYTKNMSGGVIRKNISSFQDEVDLDTGIFTNVTGIVDTIDKLRIVGFNYGNKTYGTFTTTREMTEGHDPNWGNPIAEMMYEGVRYFSGKDSATPAFSEGVDSSGTHDSNLGLPQPTWQDPYRTTSGGYPSCSKPMQLVISDVNNSYDTEQLPGSYFPLNPRANPQSFFSGDLTGLNVSTLADTIWNAESEADNVFIGESNGVKDGTPSAKAVNSFKNIRGLAPEEPTKLGGYYAGSVALYGKTTDVHTTAIGDQNIDTIAVAVASPLPRIEIPVGNKKVTLVPFGKSVCCGINITQGHVHSFQPTNQIVDFYVEKIVNTETKDMSDNGGRAYGTFRINYEDVEQGNDHDMDAIVKYDFRVISDTQVEITLSSLYAAGSIVQHMGYVISGTTTDGTYIEVRDADTTLSQTNKIVNYFLDTPPGQLPGLGWDDKDVHGNNIPLPGFNETTNLPEPTTRTFTVGSSTAASFIKHSPLWYAAKWSMTDDNENGILETDEWDSDNDGDPDGYFLVTNAGKLEQQLEDAFAEVLARSSSASAIASNSTRLDTNTKIYQAKFDSTKWDGQLLAYGFDASGAIRSTASWDAADLIPDAAIRDVYSFNPVTDAGISFSTTASNLSSTQLAALNKDVNDTVDSRGADRINYLRGDQTKEQKHEGGVFRNRESLMGDIVNSSPWYVGSKENFVYSRLSGTEGTSYSSFRASKSNRIPAIYFGANDGMLHAVNANDGNELFTYVPDAVISSLNKLTSPNYGCTGNNCIPHQFYVDGVPKALDAYIDNQWRTILVSTLGAGGKGFFALDVTDPANFTASDILWEHSTTQPTRSLTNHDADLLIIQNHLGHTISQATIVRMHNGKWAAIVANGYDSNSKKAVLFIIDVESGEIIRTIDTGVGSSSSPNGLSTPIAVDKTGNRIVDSIYAGDLQGNMWKFDVRDNDPANWQVGHSDDSGNSVPLYAARDASDVIQPITSKPQVGNHPDGGVMVYFGTGKYFEVNDQLLASPPKVQTFYGIRDIGDLVASRSELQEQEIIAEQTWSADNLDNGINTQGIDFNLDFRVVSDTEVNYSSGKRGWFMDLVSPGSPRVAKGERVISAPQLRGGRIIFATMIPTSDPCDAGGISWLMELDAVHGKRLDMAAFTGDSAYVMLDLDGDGIKERYSTSGQRYHDSGIFSTPNTILSTGDKTETKITVDHKGNKYQTGETKGNFDGRQSWQQIQ